MKSSIFATAALVATAAATSVGSAIVVNKCDYDVYVFNTPSADGGYTEIDETLSTDGTYTQVWTELTNTNGWSIKLSNSTSLSSVLQYEYTFHNDGTIWYDLSEINGNPWDADWEITSSTSTCSPKQQAYRYATDDAYGMQSCPSDASITVTLCSGDDSSDSSASSSAATSSQAAATSSQAATYSQAATTSTKAAATSSKAAATSSMAATTEAPSTTLKTSVYTTSAASSDGSGDVIVTVTQVATTTRWSHQHGGPNKRDAHRHGVRHPHGAPN